MTQSQLNAAIAVLGLVAGFLLMLLGRGMRRRRGLGGGRTVSLDRVTLTSRRLGLSGRPDRLIRQGGTVIVEEWKSAHLPRPWHRAQMGVYFLLVAERWGVVPSHGFLVSDTTRHRIDNTPELRAWVLELARRRRAAAAALSEPIPVNPSPGQCRACGQRENCGQAAG